MEKDLSAFRPTRIWKRMPSDRRLKAAEFFWTDEQSTDQQVEAVTALAAHMKFRTKSVIALPLERKAKYLAGFPGISDNIAARALVSYHLEFQRAMMAEFLDALGIAHENGLISEETVAKPDLERVRTAAAQLGGLAEALEGSRIGTIQATTAGPDSEEAIAPEIAAALAAGELEIDWPGGESHASLVARVSAAWSDLLVEGRPAVVVTHAGPLLHACALAGGRAPSRDDLVAPATVRRINLPARRRGTTVVGSTA